MDKKTLKWLLQYSFVVFVVLLLTVSTGYTQEVPEKEKFGGTLVVAVDREPKSLDCRYLGGNWRERPGYNQIYDRLIDFGTSGQKEFLPVLATGWRRIDDASWMIYLRKGVKYHNGREMTARDVKAQLDLFINTPEGWRPFIGRAYARPIKSVEIVDRYTLKISLKHPNYALFEPYILLRGMKGLGDPEQILEHQERFIRNPVGTGPFKFVKWVAGDHIIIERNENYWGPKPYLDRVVFRFLPDDQTRLLALQKGEVDIATVLGLESAPRVEKDPHIKLHKITRVRMGGAFYFNMRRWPMNELKFRQAFAMAADWKKLSEAAHPYGLGVIRRTYLKGSWAYDPKADELVLPFNPQKARTLIDEVEKSAGRKIPPLYTMAMKEEVDANFIRMAEGEIEKNLEININVHIFPFVIYRDKRRRDPKIEWDILLGGGTGPGMDPHMLFQYYSSDTPRAADGTNEMGYKNPEVDRLIKQGFSTLNQDKRKEIYLEVERILFQDVPSFPMYNTPLLFGVRNRVHGFKNHNSGQIFLTSSWNNIWIDKNK